MAKIEPCDCCECSETFTPARKDSKFCCDLCRREWLHRVRMARQHIPGHYAGGSRGKAYAIVKKFWPEYLELSANA